MTGAEREFWEDIVTLILNQDCAECPTRTDCKGMSRTSKGTCANTLAAAHAKTQVRMKELLHALRKSCPPEVPCMGIPYCDECWQEWAKQYGYEGE